MSGYIAFVKKEFTENMKNYRFLILFAVFLIFGITSAFLAKYTPEILSALTKDMEMSSEPAALDAWKQFYPQGGRWGSHFGAGSLTVC